MRPGENRIIVVPSARRSSAPENVYPGKEVMLQKIPLEEITEVVAKSIEQTSRSYFGKFDANEPVMGTVIYDALRQVSDWSRRALQFGSWHYEFWCLFDSGEAIISLELIASRRHFPVRICLLEKEIDTFDPRLHGLSYMVFTAKEFVDELYFLLAEANDSIAEWNEICRIHKPYFDEEPPFGLIVETMNNWVRERALRYATHHVDLYDVFRAIGETHPVFFGPWMIETEFKESGSWIWLRSYLQNIHFSRLSFLLKENRAHDSLDRITVEGAEDLIVETVRECIANMIAWNKLLEGGRIISAEPIGD